ncbi:MAG: hypothetical protein V7668_10510 [Cereibacter changlensis]
MMRLVILYPAWAVLTLLIVLLAGGGISLRIAADRLARAQKFLANEIEARRK